MRTAIICNGCGRVDHNVVTGLAGLRCNASTCVSQAYGLQVLGGSPWITAITAADVDALAYLNASGTLDAPCNPTSDQHLPAGSACISAGSTTDAPLVDFDGDPRDSEPDIGPDEYVP
ncbi:MAG TPA: choice-of-anchor Q domain-containing protein [Polyangiaceae bacterium]|nr:choice-of-anchor Q domain-containing protein [Polyangiaceae bacterium]